LRIEKRRFTFQNAKPSIHFLSFHSFLEGLCILCGQRLRYPYDSISFISHFNPFGEQAIAIKITLLLI
jgi:hypothetical protein